VAGYVKVPSIGDEDGVKKLLGLLQLKLDRVLPGLPLRPTRWRKKKEMQRAMRLLWRRSLGLRVKRI
jgi:hypothetical protein